MKAKAWVTGTALLAFMSVPAESVAAPELTPDETTEILSFFAQSLNGRNVTYGSGRMLSVEDIGGCQAEIWKMWCDANNSFGEEKLIDLVALARKQHGAWTLPSSLEPDAVMNYWYGFKGERPGDGYPLFLYLHGSGDRDSEWNGGLTLCTNFDDSPSIYFIPQIPNTGAYYRWWQRAKQYAWEKLLRQLYVSGDIDPNRVYFFGISEGGYGSQRLASFYADYLAAAGPMAGGEPLVNAPAENCRHIAFSLRTGANDTGFCRNQLTSVTKEAFDSLQNLCRGDYVHYVELVPGAGHGIDYSPTTPWLKKHKRNPYPKHVSWEDFAMDGVHRKGFYNLVTTKRPSTDDPVYYQLDIEDNHISITAKRVHYFAMQTDPATGITLKYLRCYTPVTDGAMLVYLNNELVDLTKPVTVTVNGSEYYSGMVTPDLKNMVNSCATFFDPERIYPAAIEVDFRPGATGLAAVAASGAPEMDVRHSWPHGTLRRLAGRGYLCDE